MNRTILLYDKDLSFEAAAAALLSGPGCGVIQADTPEKALALCSHTFDAFILNGEAIGSAETPSADGCTLCRTVRGHSAAPIIILNDPMDECYQPACYENGADLCLTKPVPPERLAALLAALLRRHEHISQQNIDLCGIKLFPQNHTVLVDGDPISMTPREFNLLHYLLMHKNVVLSREQILSAVWESDYSGNPRTVDTHIKCLRHKLGPYEKHLHTLRKVGYKFDWV